MSDYKMNTPVRGGQEVLWYRTLRALYLANRPLSKKEWLTAAGISYSDFPPKQEKDVLGIHTRWSYRHWRGLYPAMFKHFQWLKLVRYNCREKKWTMDRLSYRIFCLSLNVEP